MKILYVPLKNPLFFFFIFFLLINLSTKASYGSKAVQEHNSTEYQDNRNSNINSYSYKNSYTSKTGLHSYGNSQESAFDSRDSKRYDQTAQDPDLRSYAPPFPQDPDPRSYAPPFPQDPDPRSYAPPFPPDPTPRPYAPPFPQDPTPRPYAPPFPQDPNFNSYRFERPEASGRGFYTSKWPQVSFCNSSAPRKSQASDRDSHRHTRSQESDSDYYKSVTKEIRIHLKKSPELLNSSSGKDIVVFLGQTGAGKSTLINFLIGKRLNTNCYEEIELANPQDNTAMKIGTGKDSQTRLPEYIKLGSLVFYDLPGFQDTRGIGVELANASFIKHLIEKAQSVRLVFVAGHDTITASRGGLFKNLIETTCNLFPENENAILDSSILVITKSLPMNFDSNYLLYYLQNNNRVNYADIKIWLEEGKIFPMTKTPENAQREEILQGIYMLPASSIDTVNISAIYNANLRQTLKKIFAIKLKKVFDKIVNTLPQDNSTFNNIQNIKLHLGTLEENILQKIDHSKVILLLREITKEVFIEEKNNLLVEIGKYKNRKIIELDIKIKQLESEALARQKEEENKILQQQKEKEKKAREEESQRHRLQEQEMQKKMQQQEQQRATEFQAHQQKLQQLQQQRDEDARRNQQEILRQSENFQQQIQQQAARQSEEYNRRYQELVQQQQQQQAYQKQQHEQQLETLRKYQEENKRRAQEQAQTVKKEPSLTAEDIKKEVHKALDSYVKSPPPPEVPTSLYKLIQQTNPEILKELFPERNVSNSKSTNNKSIRRRRR